MECGVCGEEVEENWSYCPFCGSALAGETQEVDRLEKIRYMWERREGGKFIYENFPAVRSAGAYPYKEIEQFRDEIGDKVHMLLSGFRVLSFLYFNPEYAGELYKIGKLGGYYGAKEALETLKLSKITRPLNKPGFVWETLHDKVIFGAQKKGWEKNNAAILTLREIDRSKKQMVYALEDDRFSFLKSKTPLCSIQLGTLAGNAEALTDGFWDGKEVRCQLTGDDKCIFEISYHEEEQHPPVQVPSREEMDSVIDQYVEKIVDRDKNLRNKLGDYVHISHEQTPNYFLTTTSPGHRITSKQVGVIGGKRIAQKAQVKGIEEAFEYLQDLFMYLRAGILEEPSLERNRVFVEMRESVYASGVENIHTELCTFLAGIMEGVLKEATGGNWQVEEQYCQGMGRSKCGFIGKKR